MIFKTIILSSIRFSLLHQYFYLLIVLCFHLLPIQLVGQEGKGLKMVPKRQIQLKKKKDMENVFDQEKTEKLQVLFLPVHLSVSMSVFLSTCLITHSLVSLFRFPNLSTYLSFYNFSPVCSPVYLSRGSHRMDLLKREQLTVRCQPMSCSVRLSITALICCYDNTVCLPPSTRIRRPAVISTATGSTGAWSQGPAKVTAPLLVRNPASTCTCQNPCPCLY